MATAVLDRAAPGKIHDKTGLPAGLGDFDIWDIIGRPPSDDKGDEDHKPNRRNYQVTVVGAWKDNKGSRRRFLNSLGVKVPGGLSDLELAVIIHDGTNLQTYIEPVIYLELHPLSIKGFSVDYSTVFFHEGHGVHYATMEPDTSQTTRQDRPEVWVAEKPFLLPGARSEPFLSATLPKARLETLLNNVDRPKIIKEAKNNRGKKDALSTFIHVTQLIYNAISDLFPPDKLKAYQTLDRKRLMPTHSQLPVFTNTSIFGEWHIDTGYSNIFRQLGTYLFGTTGAMDRYLRADYKTKFSTLQRSITLLTVAYAVSQISQPHDPPMLFGGAGLLSYLILDDIVRTGTSGAGIIGQAYGGLLNTSRLLSRAIRTEHD